MSSLGSTTRKKDTRGYGKQVVGVEPEVREVSKRGDFRADMRDVIALESKLLRVAEERQVVHEEQTLQRNHALLVLRAHLLSQFAVRSCSKATKKKIKAYDVLQLLPNLAVLDIDHFVVPQ